MSRPERWWRPAGQRRNARPPVRSARRARYASDSEALRMFELGLDVGQAEERQRLARKAAVDDLLDVADAAGVTPLAEVDGEQLAADVERWLRGQDGPR